MDPQTLSPQTGTPVQRGSAKKGYRCREAVAAADAAMVVLSSKFEHHDWLHQARDGIELFVQRCIEQFAGTTRPGVTGPITKGSDYRAFARTAEEIKDTIAAESGTVSKAKTVPRYRDRPDEIAIPDQELADPIQPPPPKPSSGWAM